MTGPIPTGGADTALNDRSRQDALHRMTDQPLDLLVIGGGITGVGAALDAAARGLSVGLVEQGDLAEGTSSRSSKLIHGGLRYLEQLNFALVREALRERGLLLHRLAPHLVRPVPFLIPLRHRWWERLYLGAGVWLYDRLGGARHLPAARHLTRAAVARLAPGLRPTGYVGGVQYWDAQVDDDARYVLSVARAAAGLGATIATRIRAEELLVEAGRVLGVRASDVETGRQYTVRARHVATAAGAWTGGLLPPALAPSVTLRPSKGVHLVLPLSALDLGTGLLARTATGLLFVIPWQGCWLVGDTDTSWDGAPDQPVADRTDVADLLKRLNSQLHTPVDLAQVLGVFSGLRPLVATGSGWSTETVKLSREHAIATPMPGLSLITGGKFTTYRVMAAQLVDAAVADLDRPTPPTSTATIPLIGADQTESLWRARADTAARHQLALADYERLLHRYGSLTVDVLELMTERPELRRVVDGSRGMLAAEIVYACTHEGARHLDDILERRTRIGVQTGDRGTAAVDPVLGLMQATLGWSEETVATERAHYQRLITRDRQALVPDVSAAGRLGR